MHSLSVIQGIGIKISHAISSGADAVAGPAHYPLAQARRLSLWLVMKVRPSALAGKSGLAAGARQAGTVTTGRAAVLGHLGLHIVRIEPIEDSFPLVTPWKT